MTDARGWGVENGYRDVTGTWRQPPQSTIDAILATLGAHGSTEPPHWDGVVVVRGEGASLPPGEWRVELEDGGSFDGSGSLPPDIPFGYHQMIARHAGRGRPAEREDEPRQLVVSPGRCSAPPGTRLWGWSAQLYAARSADSWGIGDLGDLRRLASWSASLGASVLMTSPLHAGAEPSPYFASSRRFRDPLYLRLHEVDGAGATTAALGRVLNDDRLIDRDAVWALKSAALEEAFAQFAGAPAFDGYRAEQGAGLEAFATHAALSERQGRDWRDWPAAWRRPDASAVRAFAASPEGGRRITYHAWLQWLLDGQLAAAASQGVAIINDLAIGARSDGADAWMWQDSLAADMHVGAPPDDFATKGQDWALPPFDPWRLRATGYEPFIQTVRSALRHAGGLRVDHVMGLFRLFWIPAGAPASEGAYVRYPSHDLLAILALESHRAGAFVVGEDLGTVENLVRHELERHGVLSYRLVWFEPERPQHWPVQALGGVTTHDLPTVAGLWTGQDLAAQRERGLSPNEASTLALQGRLHELCRADEATPVDEVIVRIHGQLADSSCAVVTGTLDDACGAWERPNMPGTTDEWPNWQLALPLPLEDIEKSPLALSIADRLNARASP